MIIQLNGDGTLDVMHNGATYFDKLPLAPQGYAPMAGANFLLGARTGGEFETHNVDDLAILENARLSRPVTSPPNISSVSLSAGTIIINWTGSGMLQSTTSLSPPVTWTDRDTSSPFSESATGTRFYRVKQ